MDVIKISFYSTNQNSVALYHILDDPSVKLTLFQPPTVVGRTSALIRLASRAWHFLETQHQSSPSFPKMHQLFAATMAIS
jgi:hypothetical protein